MNSTAMNANSSGPMNRPNTADSFSGCWASRKATAKNTSEYASCVVQPPHPVREGRNGATIISYDVVAVRGMAKHGPMVSMIATPSSEANAGDTRRASSSKPPANVTASTPRIGRPTAETMNPMMAGTVAAPACAPTNGGKMRLPAPKNIEKNVNAMTRRPENGRRRRPPDSAVLMSVGMGVVAITVLLSVAAARCLSSSVPVFFGACLLRHLSSRHLFRTRFPAVGMNPPASGGPTRDKPMAAQFNTLLCVGE